ncbi:MAG: hypothetical protein HGA22_01720 [Clostridiales bacterium]|nr:hypothetical protein [Clostridiales bacterium]
MPPYKFIDIFTSDLPEIVRLINALHSSGHMPQIYIMDLYNLFPPEEVGRIQFADGSSLQCRLGKEIYSRYISLMQAAIDTVVSGTAEGNVYKVNTYEAFEGYAGRYAVDMSLVRTDSTEFLPYYFYSSNIEGKAIYTDSLTRFDVYPYYPILFDYFNLDKYRDPHPDELGHGLLSAVHLAKYYTVNGMVP